MSEVKGTKALELWCKRLIKDCPNVQIDNMTTSWRNGIAFCALVHHFRPDLIDIATLKPENIYENNRLAYSIAEKHLGIPSLLDPEDMVENDVPDRLSVLTYLSQFYQRLGHTVNTKHSENDSKFSPEPSTASNVMAPIKFGKIDLDKCAACSLPVYLAQRLIVSHKLYHRRCFRCSKCSGHLNPKNFQVIEGSEFCCDSCKTEKAMLNYVNNNDQIGMLAFNEDLTKSNTELHNEEPIVPKHKTRPQSILEKIKMFEKSAEREVNLVEKLSNVSLSDNLESNNKELSTSSVLNTKSVSSTDKMEANLNSGDIMDSSKLYRQNSTENAYKSNVNKFNFLQTQLSGEAADVKSIFDSVELIEEQKKNNNSDNETDINHYEVKEKSVSPESAGIEKSTNNMTDDIRIAKSHNSIAAPIDDCSTLETNESIIIQPQIAISVPPRKKKMLVQSETSLSDKNGGIKKNVDSKVYPDHLNPFSDEEEEGDTKAAPDRRASTNPFGSSEEEDDDVPPILPTSRLPSAMTSTPTKRLISANPFWSDGEEPSSDEESHNGSASMYNSSLATSTPNLQGTPRRKKPRAPPPPAAAASLDDVASECSLGSYTSTVHSDQKSCGAATPKLKKKRAAPTPPDSMSAMSGCGSLDKGFDTSDLRTSTDGRRLKGPAPGLPLPERREVKLQLSPEELQVQLDMLETQQLGLERQGVLIEQMIRDKCEGEDAAPAPQEEVEDLVIQLCELVNEKNDLFRKQTELMYIRRQQRLEQEQADIEHEIRVIQSRPAVNRIDADKAREEQLVARLVTIVRMRDELVQQIDAERRRERQEDLAIASSIASKRAQRSSESNSSSMKSAEVLPTPKKNKVKDKVKKQLKKAKHSLISKKKDDSDKKEEKSEKIKKSK